MPSALILQPPLLLSPDFIDYPYFTCLGAYQAAGSLRERGWEVSIEDGFARPGAALTLLDGGKAWLGEPAERFLSRAAAAVEKVAG